jgi:hypothetical protein
VESQKAVMTVESLAPVVDMQNAMVGATIELQK